MPVRSRQDDEEGEEEEQARSVMSKQHGREGSQMGRWGLRQSTRKTVSLSYLSLSVRLGVCLRLYDSAMALPDCHYTTSDAILGDSHRAARMACRRISEEPCAVCWP